MVIPHPLSHAYILTGGNAASRRAYAIRLAQAYVCEGARPPCLHCRHCEKAAGGIHPDVITVSPAEGKREILIDQARALRADAYIRPNEASRKVYLIDPADSMNAAAQNTLLKVLEEGPPYAAFLLLAEQTGGLLATIRSRCETLALPPEEESADPALQSAAEELAQLLLGEDELALMTWLAEQESAKRKNREVLDLFALTEEALRPALAKWPARAVPLLERLRSLRETTPYNVGAGHLLGWLGAAWAETALPGKSGGPLGR